jgi:hypothetical protein
VQVGAANVGGGDFDEHIGGLFNFGVRHFLDSNVTGSFVNERFHFISFVWGFLKIWPPNGATLYSAEAVPQWIDISEGNAWAQGAFPLRNANRMRQSAKLF